VEVKVKNALAGLCTVVHDQPEGIVYAQVSGYVPGDEHEMAQQGTIFRSRIRQPWNLFFGNEQYVRRRLGIDVAKREAFLVFVHDLRRNFAPDDLPE
jgi:hypothetical protein